jgi:uncharacterized membrane protein
MLSPEITVSEDDYCYSLTVTRAKGEYEMYKFTKNVVINRSQQDVFNFLSNPTNMPQWQSAVESAEWTSTGTPGVGSTY